MCVACVRSKLDYGSPVWYPLLLKTNVKKLEILENKVLQKILGVLKSARIIDLYLEANIQPAIIRWKLAIVFQSEKYQRHLINDLLCELAHELPLQRLKRNS